MQCFASVYVHVWVCVRERERKGGGASRSFLNEGETKRSVEN